MVYYGIAALVILAVGVIIGYHAKNFLSKPNEQKLNDVKEWLIYATSEAEKILGGGTGQLKLRMVYDMFLIKFPDIAKMITFDMFSSLVDQALEEFKRILATNKNVQLYIEGEGGNK